MKISHVRRAGRKAGRLARGVLGDLERRRRGLRAADPNYVYAPRIRDGSVVVDVGCASYPEFALLMMEEFGARVFAVDPTQKHSKALQELEDRHAPGFTFVDAAVGVSSGLINFHESIEFDSGSIMTDHQNVAAGRTRQYAVRVLTILDLLSEIGCGRVDLMKLDLEGAEFDLLSECSTEDLAEIDQLFVEFHHRQVGKYRRRDTRRCVDRLRNFGFLAFSADGVNYLFYRP